MTAHNTINPVGAVAYVGPSSNEYALVEQMDTSISTAQSHLSPNNPPADKQYGLYGLVITNTHASQTANVIIGSGSTPILGGTSGLRVAAGNTLVMLAPAGLGPLAVTESGTRLRVFALGAGGGTPTVFAIYRLI